MTSCTYTLILLVIICYIQVVQLVELDVRILIHQLEGFDLDRKINDLDVVSTLQVSAENISVTDLPITIIFANMKEEKLRLENEIIFSKNEKIFHTRNVVFCEKNNFAKYPFDSPSCSLKIISFNLPNSTLKLNWASKDPVKFISQNMLILGLNLISNTTSECEYESFGVYYSCIQVTFNFTRYWYEAFSKMYEPLFLLVLFAYLSFYLKEGIQRVTISSISLIISILLDTINSFTRPKTSVTTSVDRWADVCVAFCFLSLLVVVIFESLRRRKAILNEREERNIGSSGAIGVHEALITSLHNKIVLQQSKIADWIKIIYPIAFVLMIILHAVFIFGLY